MMDKFEKLSLNIDDNEIELTISKQICDNGVCEIHFHYNQYISVSEMSFDDARNAFTILETIVDNDIKNRYPTNASISDKSIAACTEWEYGESYNSFILQILGDAIGTDKDIAEIMEHNDRENKTKTDKRYELWQELNKEFGTDKIS